MHQNCVSIISLRSHLTMQDSTPTLHFVEFLCKLFQDTSHSVSVFYLSGWLIFVFILLASILLVHFRNPHLAI